MFLIIVSVFSACNDKRRIEHLIPLCGSEIELNELSLLSLVYVDDSLLIANAMSPSYKLSAIEFLSPDKPCDFLKVGHGPYEVLYSRVKYSEDTLHVLSKTPYGFNGMIKIPLNSIYDMSGWCKENYTCSETLSVCCDFDVVPDLGYVLLGGRFDQKDILSIIDRECSSFLPFDFWPEDGYDAALLPKQIVYARASMVFASGSRILYACSEGKYAAVVDISDETIEPIIIHSEYPKYKSSIDALSPEMLHGNKSGMYAFATDSLIYLSPLECRIENGQYVPADFQGYPPYYVNKIEVYDWNGAYIKTYHADNPFCSFYVTGDDRTIYTLSINKDMYSVLYRYDVMDSASHF